MEGEKDMRYVKIAMLVLVMAMALGRVVAMLPPETFKEPIFASADEGSDDDSGYSEFA